MDYQLFNDIVTSHKNSLITIGIVFLFAAIICILVIEIYVRGELDCKYFSIGKLRFSPTILMLCLIVISSTVFSIKIAQCNKDIRDLSYEEYVGIVEYSSSSIKLDNSNITIFVGKGHELVPYGAHYGKIIYSKHSKVIVFWEPIDQEIDLE